VTLLANLLDRSPTCEGLEEWENEEPHALKTFDDATLPSPENNKESVYSKGTGINAFMNPTRSKYMFRIEKSAVHLWKMLRNDNAFEFQLETFCTDNCKMKFSSNSSLLGRRDGMMDSSHLGPRLEPYEIIREYKIWMFQ